MKFLKFVALLSLINLLPVSLPPRIAARNRAVNSAIIATDGRTFVHKASGIQFDLPEDWHAKPSGDMLTVSAPDDDFKMIFVVAKDETFEAAIKETDKVLEQLMKNVKDDGPGREDELNGIKIFSLTGIGDANEKPVKWNVDVLAAKRPVMVVTFAAPDAWERNIEGYSQLLRSIRRA